MSIGASRLVWPEGLDRRFQRWATLNERLGELANRLGDVMLEDNRRGLLRGEDKDGRPLAPLAESTLRRRRAWMLRTALAPRGENSRVIRNYRVAEFKRPDGSWLVVGAWFNVLSDRGVAFLPFHAEGRGRLPVRDIAGIRPWGEAECRRITTSWLVENMRDRRG